MTERQSEYNATGRFLVITITVRGANELTQYHQVVSPAGHVIYDHLKDRRAAFHFCDHLNRGMEEIHEQYLPLVMIAKRLVFHVTDFRARTELVKALEQVPNIKKVEMA